MAVPRVVAGSKQKMVLNSSDKLFAELRDMDFPTAAARVNRDLKRLKDGYDRSKVRLLCWARCSRLANPKSAGEPRFLRHDVRFPLPQHVSVQCVTSKPGCLCVQDKSASESQIKDFTGELKAHYALLERHALVVELITKRSPGLGIQSRMRAEQLLLDSFGLDTVCETIEVQLDGNILHHLKDTHPAHIMSGSHKQ